MQVCFYIHGIGLRNDVSAICKELQCNLRNTIVIPIIWSEILDQYEKQFVERYSFIMGFIRKFSVYYAGDIVIYEKMKEVIFQLLDSHIAKYIDTYDISIVAHSLGSVIASDYLYDNPKLKIKNFFTVGSPIALYSLRYGIENFCKPISNTENWINIWNKYDVVSYPLKKLNAAYDGVVKKDIGFHKGSIFLKLLKLSHVTYFKKHTFYKHISQNWKA